MMGQDADARREASDRDLLFAIEELTAVLGGMKGAAMKLGQMLSIIDPGVLPKRTADQLRASLASLRDRAPSLPIDVMRPHLEREMGCPVEKVFATFNETPIAAASIGQVYRATLHDGRDVAVKVQYPGIDAAVRADLKNLAMMLKLSRKVLPTAAADDFLDGLQKRFAEELDYVKEGRTQHLLAERYRDHPVIVIPDAIEELTTRRVLVSDFVEGESFDHALTFDQEERDRIGEVIFRFLVGTMYLDDELNGDPHPGNILLLEDGRVAFVDFGLYLPLDPSQVAFEASALKMSMELRGDDLRDSLLRQGILRENSPVTAEQVLEYFYNGAPWAFIDEVVEVTPELAAGALMLMANPRSEQFERMHQETLPADLLFSRRTDFQTFGILGQLRARANWHRIYREWVYSEEPTTPTGEADRRWRTDRLGAVTDGSAL
jgi:predicted unusual protein kinase regulating ubiquinone biosynthesis (AarF/ABC1/UbiB family)